jgi:hypothetical protein
VIKPRASDCGGPCQPSTRRFRKSNNDYSERKLHSLRADHLEPQLPAASLRIPPASCHYLITKTMRTALSPTERKCSRLSAGASSDFVKPASIKSHAILLRVVLERCYGHTTSNISVFTLTLLQHLGIKRAHFAGRTPNDWTALSILEARCMHSGNAFCDNEVLTFSRVLPVRQRVGSYELFE